MQSLFEKIKLLFTTLNGFLRLVFLLSFIAVITTIFDFGFKQTKWNQIIFNAFYLLVIVSGIIATIIRHFVLKKLSEYKVKLFDLVTILFSMFIVINHLVTTSMAFKGNAFNDHFWLNLVIILTFVREFAERRLNYKRTAINPAQLFILSFIVIILLGSFLLTLPNATYNGISYLDALFTSTSAVCVTGLIVVDTGTYFTEFGQVIIMLLIQIGGLGILTFASYFSYFFKGGSSYENQLSLGEMTNAQKLGEVFSTLKRIILITFTIELIGGIFIYFSINSNLFPTSIEKIFFSMFHSISAFCNAGFSTYSDGLHEVSVRYNYWFQLSIVFLFVLGGLGFPIVANIVKYTKYFVLNRVLFFIKGERNYKPWVLTLNSRINLITTLSLIVVGTILFYATEYHNTLEEHNEFGKIVTSLFGATTPRTAGFNTVDMGSLRFPTIILIFLLMWIGASPSSTGGGIKTSTFAIATLNFISLAKGKSRIEVYRREIADISVRRAFAVISLSLVVIGLGVILISIFDGDKDLLSIAFECFSAYSTVGLSVGITAELSSASKLVIIALMFVGRVSTLTILIAVIRTVKHKNYRYPSEEILIN